MTRRKKRGMTLRRLRVEKDMVEKRKKKKMKCRERDVKG